MASKTVKYLAEQINRNRRRLSEWYSKYTSEISPPFYCSIDLRDSGYKIVPVDSNLYPAGFNNICPEDRRTAPAILKNHIDEINRFSGQHPVGKILILPESHTHNSYYIENLYYLNQIILDAGYESRIGWYGPLPEDLERNPDESFHLKSFTAKEIQVFPIHIQNGIMSVKNFTPELILLNNDFSSGYPKPLDTVSQPIIPSHSLGWHSRKKSEHFKYYNQLAAEFAAILDVDPWLIQIDTEEVTPVHFKEEIGMEAVYDSVDRILQRTEHSYKIHQIKRKPFVFIKNNHGTYGMGIMVVHSVDELKHMNTRTRNKMSVGKNRLPIDSVVVQEGIPTATLVNHLAAEPVIYLFGYDLIGGFLRSNTEKGEEDNLNSQGMVFKMLCMSDLRKLESELEPEEADLKDIPVLELVYGSIARLSAIATGLELAKHKKPSIQSSFRPEAVG